MNDKLILLHSRRVLVGIWSVCVLLFWIYAGVEMLDRARQHAANPREIEIGGAFWTVASLLLLSATLWIWFGDIMVELKAELLTIDTRVFKRVIHRRIACPISELRTLRLEIYERKYRGKAIRKKRLTAEYQGKRKVLLDQLSDLQARTVHDASIWRLAGGVEE
jgi:hypothetical protein